MLQQMRSAAKWIWIFVVIFFVGGFLLLETSGLLGREQITPGTAVGKVNGREISYITWLNLANSLAQQREQALGRALNLDERREIEDQAFEQLVAEILLAEEYRRRGIRVSEAEIVQAAQTSPPPALMQEPSLQTDGRFDIEKYQRLLRSPQARQGGLLLQLESYYRSEIPKAKLFDQIAGEVFVSDAKLWDLYRDGHDSAQVTFVAFDPATVPDSAVRIDEADIRRYYETNKARFKRNARALLSILAIPRVVSAADTAAARARASALREEILKGARFEEVARRESADSASAGSGGDLGMSSRDRFVPEFSRVAFSLRPGEISQPVLSPFGFHLIKVEARKGDSAHVKHILVPIRQSDSSARATDRLADQLARLAASATQPQRFDSAARALGLKPDTVQAEEGRPVLTRFGVAAGVSAWAFGGARPGETSELFDTEQAYFLARLDSLTPGGTVPYEELREEIRAFLLRRRKAEALVPKARELAAAAAKEGLEAAARARGLEVQKSALFTRTSFVPGLGRLNEAVGAAFALPVGVVSEPIVTDDGVFVLRVDRRVEASREAWEKQKDTQRREVLDAMRQARVRLYLDALRERAKIDDRRKRILTAARQVAQ